jgi:hypothetical protein
MGKPVIVSTTVTVPFDSPIWGLSMTGTPNPPGTPNPTPPPSALAQQVAATTKPSLAIRYAAAVLTGQDDMLASIAVCFDSDNARIKKQRIKKQEESWVLESSEFAPCTTGDEVFQIADDIVSRLNRILALYCNFTSTFSVEYINWISGEGKAFRTMRGAISVNVVSSKGLAELKSVSGTLPLGSAVFEAMIRDSAVKEALSLHGEDGLSWSQVYDVIEFLGGADFIDKAGYANKKKTSVVRRTANYHRHLGSSKKYTLPPNPPTLAEAIEFARGLLKRWLSSRLTFTTLALMLPRVR